jgi:hypothetical protein
LTGPLDPIPLNCQRPIRPSFSQEQQMLSPVRMGIGIALMVALAGCAASRSSNTARTGTEQMLISNAVDQSLNKVDFRPFAGHNVWLNDKYVDCVDKSYLISSVRHRILMAGGVMVDDPSKAEIHVELRSGALGTDTSESFVGVPEVTLPGMLTLPELRLLTRSSQIGTAKMGLVAIDARTGSVLGTGGTSLAQSDTQNWFVMGVGPIRTGSINHEVDSSTSGSAARIRSWLPASVAFQSPPPLEADFKQYAGADESRTTPVGFQESAVDSSGAATEMTAPRRLSGSD